MTKHQITATVENKPPAVKRQSKTDKKQKNLYLSSHARQLLDALSRRLGISETAVVELLVREKAARENIELGTDIGVEMQAASLATKDVTTANERD